MARIFVQLNPILGQQKRSEDWTQALQNVFLANV